MDLMIVGCSGSLPGPDAPASCYLVSAEHEGRTWRVLLDLGSGALGALQRHTDPLGIDAVVLSHLHPDHCLDLTALHVMRRHGPRAVTVTGDVAVWGPAGTDARMARAYGVGEAEPLTGIAWGVLEDGEPVSIGPFTITPHRVLHPVRAYGLRVEADGEVLGYSGDTDACPGLLSVLAGADLALVECGFEEGDETRGIHLTPSRAAAAAAEAGGVGRLVLTHLTPWADREAALAVAAEVFDGPVEVVVPDRRYAVSRA